MAEANHRNFGFAGLVAGSAMLLGGATGAVAYSGNVRSACTNDYLQFCPQYEEGSPKLKACMRAQGRKLSPNCIRALVDAGIVKRSALKGR